MCRVRKHSDIVHLGCILATTVILAAFARRMDTNQSVTNQPEHEDEDFGASHAHTSHGSVHGESSHDQVNAPVVHAEAEHDAVISTSTEDFPAEPTSNATTQIVISAESLAGEEATDMNAQSSETIHPTQLEHDSQQTPELTETSDQSGMDASRGTIDTFNIVDPVEEDSSRTPVETPEMFDAQIERASTTRTQGTNEHDTVEMPDEAREVGESYDLPSTEFQHGKEENGEIDMQSADVYRGDDHEDLDNEEPSINTHDTAGVSPAVDGDITFASSTRGPETGVANAEADLYAATGLYSRLDQWYWKQYLGGYRDRRSGIEFFHASTQTPTPQEIRAKNAPEKFHRDTQTKFIKHRKTQARRDSATQMSKPGCFISCTNDYVVRAKRYVTAAEHEAWLTKHVIRLQCWVRCVYAKRKVAMLRRLREAENKAMKEKERRRKQLAEKRRKKEMESRIHPKTTKDFEVLYNGLEMWRQQETGKINAAEYSEPARLAALADLMDQEAALIQKIDRLKIVANDENRERKITRLLDAMASPKQWATYDKRGAAVGMVTVDTPNTIRARELKDLYHALNVSLVSVDERLQILLHVKYTVKEFDCNLTREIVELIDREGDLVSRGRDAKSMEGLRRRISNLFLQFIRTPEFNPEAALHQSFPDVGDAWKRDQAVYYCRSCTRYLPSTQFYLSTTMKHLGKCKACANAENLATARQDDGAYAELLNSIRIQEAHRRASCGAPSDEHYNAISLLQEADMRHLVDRIWNRQSAVSGDKTLESLVFCRWNPAVEFSPWNCILLTKDEAATHEKHPNPEDVYSYEFVRKIQQRHFAARQHFGQLPAMEKYLKRHYIEDASGELLYRA
ncbi:hypothetical protein BC832DRAFT_545979 [Gaertneriomyces semiglobifer]|nr:hypothetical protein BC832DRAFT_545979 [Gaertneriomyces semiglobifer]